ncbi:MAG: hypothetical protein U0413_00085 [Candidatus Saccharimonadales bacterium]
MVPNLTTFAAEATNVTIMAKGIMLGVALGAAAFGLAWIGSSYMKALGRNPEAGKAAGQIIIIAAMVEVTALLAFLLGAFLLS